MLENSLILSTTPNHIEKEVLDLYDFFINIHFCYRNFLNHFRVKMIVYSIGF